MEKSGARLEERALVLNKQLSYLSEAVVEARTAREQAEDSSRAESEKVVRLVEREESLNRQIISLEAACSRLTEEFPETILFSPRVDEILRDHIRRRLDEANIVRDVLTEMPFTIASAEEFEVASQLIARKGIAPLMSSKTSEEKGTWSLMPFLLTDYQDELADVSWSLFKDEWGQLLPGPPGGIR